MLSRNSRVPNCASWAHSVRIHRFPFALATVREEGLAANCQHREVPRSLDEEPRPGPRGAACRASALRNLPGP